MQCLASPGQIGHLTGMSETSPNQPKALDHCVLPVPELAIARDRLTALGFTVAADAQHPFGTENACVFFADGTYLEPLAVAQREDCERTAMKGNVFTARDQTYRFRNGDNGFSAIALTTKNADGDHRGFAAKGISAGKKLIFGRKMTGADGKSAQATFKLAFASDLRSPDSFFFVCERVNVPAVDRAALERHANGVTGIAEIVVSEKNPTDFQYFLQAVTSNRETEAHSFGMEIACANANINVMTPEGLAMQFGVRRVDDTRGLRCEGIVMTVDDMDALEIHLTAAGVGFETRGAHLVVPASAGLGCFLAFKKAA